MLRFLIKICRFNFGEFESNEFTKFLRMGGIFALIIGSYWTLRSLKDSNFIQLVDKMQIPYAKTISVLALLPLVIFYTKLLGRTSRERMFVILPVFYGSAVLLFSFLMLIAQGTAEEIACRPLALLIGTKTLGYIWYIFVESFGSLAIALFWAFSTDTTDPTSAKRGFPLVIAIGQIGGIVCPYSIAGLPYRLGLTTDTLSIAILGVMILSIVPFFRHFTNVTPSILLRPFHVKDEKPEIKEYEDGPLEGFKLILANKYLIGIFAANFIYDFIVTIFDFNFKIAAGARYSGVELSNYLSIYASSVNAVSLLCLLLGISNITRFLGIGAALISMPVIMAFALLGFLTLDNVSFLFALMVGSKAINYAMNGPALKQLYIPTTMDVRFKAQAWIETFGSRTAKEAASILNMLLKPLQNVFGEVAGKAHYLGLSALIGFPMLIVWFVTALYLGKRFRRAVDANEVVC